MIGPRVGLKAGERIGLAVGVSADPISASSSAMAGVTRDGSGAYTPASDSEWTIAMAAAGISSGNPSNLYLAQEASGNLADTIGSATFTALGTAATYQQSVSGWTRKAVTFADGGSTHFNATIASATTTSYLFLAYAAMTATPAASRSIFEHPNIYEELTSGGVFRASGAVVGTGLVAAGTSVRPLILQSSIGRSVLQVVTDSEIVSGGFGTFAGTTATLGGSTTNTAPMNVLYGAAFVGAAADLTDAQIRTLLTTLGWSVGW